jgi:hypothetical protein
VLQACVPPAICRPSASRVPPQRCSCSLSWPPLPVARVLQGCYKSATTAMSIHSIIDYTPFKDRFERDSLKKCGTELRDSLKKCTTELTLSNTLSNRLIGPPTARQ